MIIKKDLVNFIYGRLGEAVEHRSIQDAVMVIIASLKESLILEKEVTVKNFGSFRPKIFHQHAGFNVAVGQMTHVPAFKTVTLKPSPVFLALIAAKRNAFSKRRDSSEYGLRKKTKKS